MRERSVLTLLAREIRRMRSALSLARVSFAHERSIESRVSFAHTRMNTLVCLISLLSRERRDSVLSRSTQCVFVRVPYRVLLQEKR